jgi:Tol biopolymer transport system component
VADGPPIALGVSGFGALWSPDGRRVLYATQFGVNSDLAVVNADGTGRRDLLAGASVKASMISPPGFSADGATVSFVGSDNTAYFVGADGHNLRPALPPVVAGASTVTAFATAWSPDHSSLAVLTGGAGLVVVVDTSSHVQASVTLPASAAPLTISFDGSGRYIYYMGFPRGGVPSPPMNLFSVALNGGAAAQLTTDGSVAITPTVLP